MAQKSRHRGFCVTDYELNQEFWESYKSKCDYIIRGQEICPTTGRTHWQMYIHVPNARTLKSVIKDLTPRHVIVANGTGDENYEYCTKDGTEIWEHGIRPKQGERTDLKKIQEMIKANPQIPEIEIAELDFAKWCQYGKRFEAYRKLVLEPNDRRFVRRMWMPEVYIIYGNTGTGKTSYVHDKHGYDNVDAVALSGDKSEPFILGYRNRECVLFDDFETKQVELRWILRALDRYPMKCNIKGGEAEWNPKYIYFTTNHDPYGWWEDQGAPFYRRIKEIIKI